jgi:hypothetical protein
MTVTSVGEDTKYPEMLFSQIYVYTVLNFQM